MDPNTAYGSPYGGFSRATASRLASMPLMLPNVAQELADYESVYMTTRDSSGQEYACKVYHEDELDAQSLDEGMFDVAVLKRPEDVKNPPSTDSTSVKKRSLSELGNKKEVAEDDEVKEPTQIATLLQSRLMRLKGMCAQFHEGWWSYEWYVNSKGSASLARTGLDSQVNLCFGRCYEGKVRQFHVHIDSAEGSTHNIQITDVTSLGTFSERKGKYISKSSDDDNDDENKDSEQKEPARNPNALAEITDLYLHGGWCPTVKKSRITQSVLRCCSPQVIARNRGSVLYKGQVMDTNLLAMQGIVEDSTCVYNVTICTPLLCSDYAEEDPPKKVLKEDLKPATVSEARAGDETLDPSTAADMTVVEILKSLFGKNKCMQTGTGGWYVVDCDG